MSLDLIKVLQNGFREIRSLKVLPSSKVSAMKPFHSRDYSVQVPALTLSSFWKFTIIVA